MSIIKKPDGEDENKPSIFDKAKIVSEHYEKKGGKLTTQGFSAPKDGDEFRNRVNANKLGIDGEMADNYAVLMPNRILLDLDCSGSMQGEEMTHLKSASEEFIGVCDPSTTSLAIWTFGKDHELRGELSRDLNLLKVRVGTLNAEGGTPMKSSLQDAIVHVPVTRVVLVTDGCPTDWHGQASALNSDPLVDQYRKAGVPIDTVFIGTHPMGALFCERLAELTKGLYIRFSASGNFAGAFKYLAPAYRAALTEGRVTAKDIGASEIKGLK